MTKKCIEPNITQYAHFSHRPIWFWRFWCKKHNFAQARQCLYAKRGRWYCQTVLISMFSVTLKSSVHLLIIHLIPPQFSFTLFSMIFTQVSVDSLSWEFVVSTVDDRNITAQPKVYTASWLDTKCQKPSCRIYSIIFFISYSGFTVLFTLYLILNCYC